LAGDRRAASAS
jgi:hypothetical protein